MSPIDPNANPSVPDDAKLARTLVREGAVSEAQVRAAEEERRARDSSGLTLGLEEILVRQGVLTAEQIRDVLARTGLTAAPNAARSVPDEAVAPVPAAAQAGRPFGRYRLLEELGHGGMGVVWKAWDSVLDRVVALKGTLAGAWANEVEVARFLREARAAARLCHPNIVPVHDVGSCEDQYYFTCDFIQGRTLDALMDGPMAPRRACALVKTVAEALHYAHGQGIVHRDIKPGNILVDGHDVPHVMDFGLAKDVQRDDARPLTLTGDLLGTPRYMSPEQASGRQDLVGPGSDQFSLGVVLYELLAGRPAFDSEKLHGLLLAIAEREPAPIRRVNPRVHRDLETICLRAIEKVPARRYPTLAAFAEDLGRWLDGEPILARPTSAIARICRRALRHRTVTASVAAAVLAAGGFGAWAVASARGEKEKEAQRQEALAESAAHQEATQLLESGRFALDEALLGLYDERVPWPDLVRAIEASQAQIEEAVRRAPGLVVGHYLLGCAWKARGCDIEAEACWRKAASLNPSFAPARYRIGCLLLQRVRVLDLTGNEEERAARRPAMRAVAEEGSREIDAALAAGGLDDPVQREVASAMRAYAAGDERALRGVVTEALGRLGERRGTEELWLLSSSLAAGEEQSAAVERALSVRPRFPEALVCRAALKARQGDLAGAVADFDRALDLAPRFRAAWLNRGDAHDRLGDSDAAIADFTKALEIDRDFVWAWLDRGLARLRKGQHTEAIVDLDEALARSPRCVPALAGRAAARLASGDADGAIADCEAAIGEDPKSADAYGNRGLAWRAKGDDAAALADFGRALALDPSDVETWINRGALRLDHRDWPAALADLDVALKLDPRSAKALANRGLVKARTGDVEGGLADLDAAVAIQPPQVGVLIARAGVRSESGDQQGSVRDLDEALRLNRASLPAHFNRGNSRLALGDLDGAMEDYDAALCLRPGMPDALMGRASVRLRRREWAGALADLDLALAARPDYAEAHVNRATARANLGDVEGQIDDLERALVVAPKTWPYRAAVEQALEQVRRGR